MLPRDLALPSKFRAWRPDQWETARDLAGRLQKCPAANAWSVEDADAWWSRHERGHRDKHDSPPPDSTTHSGFDRTIDPESS